MKYPKTDSCLNQGLPSFFIRFCKKVDGDAITCAFRGDRLMCLNGRLCFRLVHHHVYIKASVNVIMKKSTPYWIRRDYHKEMICLNCPATVSCKIPTCQTQ